MRVETAISYVGKTRRPKEQRASWAGAHRGGQRTGAIWCVFLTCISPLGQGRPPQQVVRGLPDLIIVGVAGTRTGNEYSVPTGFHRTGAKCFSQSTLDLVPCYSVTDALTDHKTKAASVEAVGQIAYYQEPVRGAAAIAVNLGYAQALSQAGALLHD